MVNTTRPPSASALWAAAPRQAQAIGGTGASASGRPVPDVSALAGGEVGYRVHLNGKWTSLTGPGAATCLWGGLVARPARHSVGPWTWHTGSTGRSARTGACRQCLRPGRERTERQPGTAAWAGKAPGRQAFLESSPPSNTSVREDLGGAASAQKPTRRGVGIALVALQLLTASKVNAPCRLVDRTTLHAMHAGQSAATIRGGRADPPNPNAVVTTSVTSPPRSSRADAEAAVVEAADVAEAAEAVGRPRGNSLTGTARRDH